MTARRVQLPRRITAILSDSGLTGAQGDQPQAIEN